MQLAKAALDVGLYTNTLDAMLEFWQQDAGVPFAELLPVGGGVRQHRHAIGDSVLKVNHAREPLPDAPNAGYQRLLLARDIVEPRSMNDPDGNAVTLVPRGHDGITQLRLELAVNDLDAQRHFYGSVLGFDECAPDTFAIGASQLRLLQGQVPGEPEQRAPGYRYITVQVFDVRETHAGIIEAGGREGMAPVKLGDVAHISFVRDVEGNWIEISQRKSITGSLD